MDLEIGDIHVSIEDDDIDQAELTRLVEWHLTQAFEIISKQGQILPGAIQEIESINLPDFDLASQTNKSEKLANMILNVLESKL
ncbi:MAG: hypothetical protein GY705_09845 [Bacteroidetes bacterium]|nr:hypothetical protein [Bacteroidota bacterium]